MDSSSQHADMTLASEPLASFDTENSMPEPAELEFMDEVLILACYHIWKDLCLNLLSRKVWSPFAQHNIPTDIKNSVSRLVPHFHDLLSNATIQGNTKDVLPEPWTSHSQVFSSQPNAPPAI